MRGMTITVHHLENSRSQRVLWLLEELGLRYEIKHYRRDPNTLLAPPELRQVHPLGKSPVISDGDITVAESGAIVEYLLEAHGGAQLEALRGAPGTPERRRCTYFLHFAEGSLMPPLLMKLVFDKVQEAKVPFFIKPVLKGVAAQVNKAFIGPNLTRLMAFLEAELAGRDWFTGKQFSAADIQMSYPVEAAAARGVFSATSHPKLAAWLDRIHARPAFARALAAGGPYSPVP
jgi:glutathione S-transferase